MKVSLRMKAVLGIVCMSIIISATAIALSYWMFRGGWALTWHRRTRTKGGEER